MGECRAGSDDPIARRVRDQLAFPIPGAGHRSFEELLLGAPERDDRAGPSTGPTSEQIRDAMQELHESYMAEGRFYGPTGELLVSGSFIDGPVTLVDQDGVEVVPPPGQ